MIEKLTAFIEGKIVPRAIAFAEHSFVKSLQAGMIAPIAATIMGSILMILQTPPAAADSTNQFILAWRNWSELNTSWLSLGVTVTINSIGLYGLIGFVYDYSLKKGLKPTNIVLTSLMTYFALSTDFVDGGLVIGWLGPKGLFPAIIIGTITVLSAKFLLDTKLKIQLPETVPPNIAVPIQSILVNIIIISSGFLIRVVLMNYDLLLPEMINKIFEPLVIAGDSLIVVILTIGLGRVLWFFGIHGANITGPIIAPVLTAAMAENMLAYSEGRELPYIYNLVFNQTWQGAAMLSVAITIILIARSEQLKAIGKISLVPAFFNIGEPLTFGVPLVLNFTLALPYIFIFPMNAAVAYLLTKWGFMSRVFVHVPWTTPLIFKSYLSNLDWRSIPIYLGLMILNILILAPFMKRYDNQLLKIEKEGT